MGPVPSGCPLRGRGSREGPLGASPGDAREARATDASGTGPMQKLLREYRLFLSYPRDMRILLLTNLIYAFVGPVIDIFVGAYVMRNSRDARMVVTYQLAVYAGIPFAFLINGFPLQHVAIKRLYSLGMLLSGVSMAVMMALG